MKIENLILESIVKSGEGKSLRQQTIENFVEKELNLTIEKISDCAEDFTLVEILAKNESFPNQEYSITVDSGSSYTLFEPFNLFAVIDSVKDVEKNIEFKTKVVFPFNLSKKDELKKWILNESVESLLKEEEDVDLKFIIQLIKDNCYKYGLEFSYYEVVPNNKATFVVDIENGSVVISNAFSNAIQVDFNKKDLLNMKSLNVVYREISNTYLEYDICSLFKLVNNFLKGEVQVGGFNFTPLFEHIREKDLLVEIDSNSLISERDPILFEELVVGTPLEFKSANIKARLKDEKIIVDVNFLMNKETIELETVESLIETIDKINNILK